MQLGNPYVLNNTLLTNRYIKEQVFREMQNYFEVSPNENAIYNLWDAAKAQITGKFFMLNSYIRRKKNLKSTV